MVVQILIALGIGLVAGLLDILPMLKDAKTKPPVYRYSIGSVFATWILLGLVIPFISWGLQPWLKGFIVGFGGMVPTMIHAYARVQSFPIALRILVHGGVLGTLVGVAADVLFKLAA
ncbi:hypothetical protein ACLVWU_10765 [Bdellovibrio sp. HCB290]|uniref:hypothetical protein n=1 Tax=Bdellovibrio sp. HCB290 TaxID=3394356 RepID=UPI0039B41D22